MSGWHRTSRQSRGYGAAWQRARAQALHRDKHLCQPCLTQGRVTPATEVDHITPKAKGGTDDMANLRSTCTPCHQAKTAEENGRTLRPKRKIGADGWPC